MPFEETSALSSVVYTQFLARWFGIYLGKIDVFGADAKTTFTNLAGNFPVTLKTGLGGSWAQLGLGVSGRVADNVNLFAAADYSVAVGEGEGHSLGGRVGLRMTW